MGFIFFRRRRHSCFGKAAKAIRVEVKENKLLNQMKHLQMTMQSYHHGNSRFSVMALSFR